MLQNSWAYILCSHGRNFLPQITHRWKEYKSGKLHWNKLENTSEKIALIYNYFGLAILILGSIPCSSSLISQCPAPPPLHHFVIWACTICSKLCNNMNLIKSCIIPNKIPINLKILAWDIKKCSYDFPKFFWTNLKAILSRIDLKYAYHIQRDISVCIHLPL